MAFGDFTITRASTKNVLGSAGTYVSVANNTPAFEFNTDGTYRGLLVEPGATNLLTYSQEFDNAAWNKSNINTTGTPPWVNVAVAPDGTTTAKKIIEDTSNTRHQVSVTGAFTQTSTFSVFAKASERTIVGIGNSTDAQYAQFNLSAGTVISAGTGTISLGAIQNVGNGWYRVSCLFTHSGVNKSAGIIIYQSSGVNLYTGDGTSGLFIWQAQLETGSVATSPIVTTGSTATRVADVISLTSASSLIGQTEGTLYAEIEARIYTAPATRRVFSLSDGTSSNRLLMLVSTANGVSMFVSSGGSTQVNETYSSGLTGIQKIAIRYASNAFYLHVGGSLRNSDTVGNVSLNMSRVDIGNEFDGTLQLNGWIRSVALYPTSITESQANSLTA